MSIQISGVLVDPMGNPSTNTEIRAIAEATLVTIQGMVASIHSDKVTGAYSFNLVEGRHTVEIMFKDEYTLSGDVTIPSGVLPNVALEELLLSYATPTT